MRSLEFIASGRDVKTLAQAEAEWVAGRVKEHPESGSRLVFVLGRAKFEDLCFGCVEVVHHNVEVHLLRYLLARPLRRPVGVHLLETQGIAVIGFDGPPVLALFDLPVEQGGIELCEYFRVGAVENNDRKACDSHSQHSRCGSRDRPQFCGLEFTLSGWSHQLSVGMFFVLVSTPMSDVLELDSVSVVRGKKTLLDKVDWQVNDGERWVILGPNGAGKTTLLQIAAARMHPSSGTAGILDEILGRVDVFELRPRIGLSSAALATQIPEHENVLNVVVTAAYGVTGRWREGYERDDERRAFRLLNDWGMGPLLNRTFATLSEGERKRVQIARALMTDPELLLLDEPAAGLDLGGREELVHKLGELARDEAAPAMVLVTHHLEEVPPGFTHAMLLRDGGVVAAGPITEVLTAENLSETFGLDLDVTENAGRYTAVARR
ncbi:ABC-type molybdenum transport system, ATPase component/photorepair protein PhrA [Arthrobacter sp. OV608]|nr:ABC-type molybdenum transport system, ATPase component/photorepair protein PhrA [Arthrobacter sp. OV608]